MLFEDRYPAVMESPTQATTLTPGGGGGATGSGLVEPLTRASSPTVRAAHAAAVLR